MGVTEFDLGEKIRAIRKGKKMTIKEVASQAGVTIGLISQIERNLANPSVKSLRKIADVLGVPIAALFSHHSHGLGPIVRAHDRQILHSAKPGITYSLLTPGGYQGLELIYGVYEPGTVTGETFFIPGGEECCHILQGEMNLFLGEQEFHLAAGDTIALRDRSPLRIEVLGEGELHALWAIAPQRF